MLWIFITFAITLIAYHLLKRALNKKIAAVLWPLAVLSLFLIAANGELPVRVEEIIATVVSILLMLLGPKPLKAIYDLLNIPGGAWRVVATFVVSFVVGVAALVIAGGITGVPTDIESILALAGLIQMAVTAAYHRLKDLGKMASSGAPTVGP